MSVTKKRLSAPLHGVKKTLQKMVPGRALARKKPEPPAAPTLSPQELQDLAWESYLIPDVPDDVLRNKFTSLDEPYGITNPYTLARLEEDMSKSRMLELLANPIKGTFDLDHMKRVHEHLFQDVYDWAGQERTVDLAKAGHSYAPTRHIGTIWEAQHAQLKKHGLLRGITDPGEFAEKLAFHWGMVNVAHAFREGNTRSQTMFFHQLADEAGWDLDVAKLGPDHPESVRDEFLAARFHHQSNGFDHKPLAEVLSKVIAPQPQMQRQRDTSRGLTERYRRFPELAPSNSPDPENTERTGPERSL